MSACRQWLLVGYVALGLALATGHERPSFAGKRTFGTTRPLAVANVAAAVSARTTELTEPTPAGLGLTGRGVAIGVWDQAAARTTHQDLKGRVFALDSAGAADHSTHVAATIAGSGASQAAARGIAPGALLLTRDWSLDAIELRESAPYLSVSAHAYGFRMGWATNPACSAAPSWLGRADDREDSAFGKYGAEARAVDAIAYSTGALTVWAAGNERQDVGASGEPHFHFPDCVDTHTDAHASEVEESFDTLGLQLAAKNTLVVGAAAHIDAPPADPDEIAVLPFSSFGPLDDGRIKPDLVASGALIYSATAASDDAHGTYSGTSSSAAVVAGAVALLTEHHRALVEGTDLPADALRALLLHSAAPLRADRGPSYAAGYGVLDAKRAADLISADAAQLAGFRQIALGVVRDGETFEVPTAAIAAGAAFRVSIAWTDPPAAINEGGVDDPTPALVNDLDLALVAPEDRTTAYPWSLDHSEPERPATRRKLNRVDNAEVVDVSADLNTEPGAWTIRVTAHGDLYRKRAQRFALVADVPFTRPEEPVLEAPRAIVIEADRGERPPDTVVKLRNQGGDEPLAIAASTDASWLTVLGDDIAAPGSLALRAATEDLEAGLHFATVQLAYEGEGPRSIGVVLDVTCAPDCADRQCGLDPRCGSSCGGCAAAEYCSAQAQCEPWSPGCPAADLGSSLAQVATLGTTQGAGDDSEGSCGGVGADDIAFAWAAPEAGTYRIATDGSVLDTVLYVRDSCEGDELACNDDNGSTTSAVSIELEAAQAIVVVVDGAAGAGDFHLSIEQALSPDADLGSMLGTAVAAGSTSGSTDRAAGPCSDTGRNDAAFSWTAPSAATYTFSTALSADPHRIFVRAGDWRGEDRGCASSPGDDVIVELETGERVAVFVEAAESQGGGFNLGITSNEGVCAGNCDGSPNDGACFCDSACVDLHDCCEDACAICGSCCVPQCDGRACGDDGCGGSCGDCLSGERCDVGLCVADPCAQAENGAACDDGDDCTVEDRCIGGRCAGIAAVCDPGDAGEAVVEPDSGEPDTEVDAGGDGGLQSIERPDVGCGCSVPGEHASRSVFYLIFVVIVAARRMSRSRSRSTARSLLIALGLFAGVACDAAADDQAGFAARGGEGGSAGYVAEHDSATDERPPVHEDRDADVRTPDVRTPDDDAGAEGNGCGAGECDLLDPLSCGEDHACTLMIDEASNEPRALCSESGAGLDGDACDSPAECSSGLDCTSFGEGGTCRRYCCALNTTAGCPEGQFCRVALEDMSAATGVALCDRCDDCDATDPDSCGADQGCYPLGAGCAGCLRAGASMIGESCALADDCEPGSACFSVDGELRCAALCHRDEPRCPTAASCEAAEGLPEGIGICL